MNFSTIFLLAQIIALGVILVRVYDMIARWLVGLAFFLYRKWREYRTRRMNPGDAP